MENIEATLWEMINKIIKFMPIILICALLGGGFNYIRYQRNVKTFYTANATLYAIANGDTESLNMGINNLTLSKDLLPSYYQVLRTDQLIEKVIKETEVDYSIDQIRDMIGTGGINGTSFFKMSITCENEEDALNILKAFIKIGPQEIYDVIKIGYFQQIDISSLPLEARRESYKTTILLGTVIGGAIPLLISIILILIDGRVHSETEIKRYYNLSTLGNIPNIKYRRKIKQGGKRNERKRKK